MGEFAPKWVSEFVRNIQSCTATIGMYSSASVIPVSFQEYHCSPSISSSLPCLCNLFRMSLCLLYIVPMPQGLLGPGWKPPPKKKYFLGNRVKKSGAKYRRNSSGIVAARSRRVLPLRLAIKTMPAVKSISSNLSWRTSLGRIKQQYCRSSA